MSGEVWGGGVWVYYPSDLGAITLVLSRRAAIYMGAYP